MKNSRLTLLVVFLLALASTARAQPGVRDALAFLVTN